ncbi:hypothetical protein ACS0TY_035234 [Phlomoides rotata]
MSDIPDELLREILVRLPADTLLRLRSVCKQWIRVIDDSSFIKAHTHNQLYSHTLLVKNGSGAPLYSFDLDSLDFINNGPQMVDAIHIKQLVHLGVPRLWTLFDWSVCNSLILIIKNRDFTSEDWVMIWNPLTKECREVQVPKLNVTSKSCRYAFGYDYDSDDYKVVKIDKLEDEWQTLIYSLKSDSWRKIEDCPPSIGDCNAGNTSFNGTLYWPSRDTIIALDLGTESFFQLPLPLVDRSEFGIFTVFHLDALDGCLVCSLDYSERYTFYGWVMKDNGVEKTWNTLFSLQYKDNLRGLRLAAYLKGKEQVVLQHHWCFLWIDIGTNSVKKFSIHGFPGISSSKICPGSLVRLNVRDTAIGMGDVSAIRASTRKRKRKTEITVTRLKFCVRYVGETCNSSCYASKCRLCRLEKE